MTHDQITLDSQTWQRLFKSGENSLGQLLEAVVNQVLEAQLSEQLQAAPYERTEERQGYRNGQQPRRPTTTVGGAPLGKCRKCARGRSERTASPATNAASRLLVLTLYGDGGLRGLDPQSGAHHRGSLGGPARQIDRLRPLQRPGSAGDGSGMCARFERAALPLRAGRRVSS